jgi:hypothetical protein
LKKGDLGGFENLQPEGIYGKRYKYLSDPFSLYGGSNPMLVLKRNKMQGPTWASGRGQSGHLSPPRHRWPHIFADS